MAQATAINIEQNQILTSKEHDYHQFLSFVMANEEYGVPILAVQEIRGWEPTTSIPNAPKHVKGVINLRGTIVPIIDLRERFGIDSLAYGSTTVVIVLKVELANQQKVIGIVVDAVSDVFTIAENEIRVTPDFGNAQDLRFIRGLASVSEKMVILLDINMLLGKDSLPDAGTLSNIIKDLELDTPVED
ncbi:MAG: chemotaxis protein CheW [Shewanella sp.]|uniref:chemotaxis protein CheW n=1 Tax=Shewanella sp. SNU WT4 TaxID=2590015 RepID=UPI00112E28CF|nr:chemotaxis protein CheW [Shewanella sp. SNU WT4]QDF65698.1 purine-binding chemotaxis protein CheW [Shewanella sp. SNU WT4]